LKTLTIAFSVNALTPLLGQQKGMAFGL